MIPLLSLSEININRNLVIGSFINVGRLIFGPNGEPKLWEVKKTHAAERDDSIWYAHIIRFLVPNAKILQLWNVGIVSFRRVLPIGDIDECQALKEKSRVSNRIRKIVA